MPSRKPSHSYTLEELARRTGAAPALLIGITGAVGLIALVIGYYSTINPISGMLVFPESQTAQLRDLKTQVNDLTSRLNGLDASIASMSQHPSEANTELQLSNLTTEISDLSNKVSVLDQTILEDPNKAIALPLLQKDLEASQTIYDAKLTALQQSVNQINTYVTGFLVVIGLGFLGLAGTFFLAQRRPEAK
jgi:hypothetical protein